MLVISQVIFKETKETNFSVKSSWEVHLIVMFQKNAVCKGGRPIIVHRFTRTGPRFF